LPKKQFAKIAATNTVTADQACSYWREY